MGKLAGSLRGLLSLALVLSQLGVSACVAADTRGKPFAIPAQPAGAALNEFAKQADITLIFSYDLVVGERTPSLNGRFTVDEGLTRLLNGTSLGFRQAANGAYLICARALCGS
jgi:hypothetical protein